MINEIGLSCISESLEEKFGDLWHLVGNMPMPALQYDPASYLKFPESGLKVCAGK